MTVPDFDSAAFAQIIESGTCFADSAGICGSQCARRRVGIVPEKSKKRLNALRSLCCCQIALLLKRDCSVL